MLKKDNGWLGAGLCLLITALSGGFLALIFSIWSFESIELAKTLIFAFVPAILLLRYYAHKKLHNATKGVATMLFLLFILFFWQIKL